MSVDELIERYSGTAPLISASRRLLRTAFPDSTETADLKAGLISYSYGAGYKNMLATLILGKQSLKVGIPYGAAFDDPRGLLKGSGKVHKHIPIHSTDDLEQPGMLELLSASREAWQRRTSSSAPIRRRS